MAGTAAGTATATTSTAGAPGVPAAAFVSSIFPNTGELEAIAGWVQADFPAFAGKAVKFERCYSMAESGDGGLAKGFHAGCDGKGPTVTVLKTTHPEGHIFGGAADKSWTSTGTYAASEASFLFCVSCAGAAPGAAPSQLKLTGDYNQYALLHNMAQGPTFGRGSDLFVTNNAGGRGTHATATWTRSSFSALGDSYTCPAGVEKCDQYLAGSRGFAVADYEVFVATAE